MSTQKAYTFSRPLTFWAVCDAQGCVLQTAYDYSAHVIWCQPYESTVVHYEHNHLMRARPFWDTLTQYILNRILSAGPQLRMPTYLPNKARPYTTIAAKVK